MYKLYYAPGAASLCVHLALIELRADFELIALDLKAGEQKRPEYLALNPAGVVPTLMIDGAPVTEAAALLMILAERHPEAGLAPAPESAGRQGFLQWMFYLANTLQPAFRHWWYPHEIAGEQNSERVQAEAGHRIGLAFDRIDAHLQEHGPYMLGTHYTVLDIYAVMLMRWSRNMPKPALEWSACRVLADRVRARPAWKQLYAAEGLSEWA